MRRWIFKILLISFVLVLVTAVAVQVILFTDLPRRLTLRTLNQELGLDVTAGTLRTTFFGKTRITDFTLRLPMENAPLLIIPEMNISHTAVPLILLGKSFKLQSAKIVSPVLNINEDETGAWNIREFVYHLQQEAAGMNEKTAFVLPQLDIVNGTCVVTDKNGYVEKVSPVIVKGESQKLSVWNFEINVASQIMVSGRAAQGSDWSHEVNIDINDLPNAIKNIVPQLPEHLVAKAGWKGRIRENVIDGQLQIEQAKSGEIQTKGTLGIEMSPAWLAVNFDNLLISGFKSPLEQISVLGGLIHFDGKRLQAEKILVEAGQNHAYFTGKWNLDEQDGDFTCSLDGMVTERNINYEITWYGTVGWPKTGKKQVSLSAASQGKSPWGNWQSEAKIIGSGNNLSNSQWQVNIPVLTWKMQDTNIDARDIKAEINANWPAIKLVGLDLANAAKLKADGEFSADTNNWNISLDAEGFKANEDQNLPMDLRLIAGGNMEKIAIEDLRMIYKYLRLEAAGDVALPSMELSNAHAKASMILSPTSEPDDNFAHISGNFVCETAVTGTVWPANLQLQAVFSGDNITMNKKVIEPVNIPWQAEIDTSRIKYKAERFQLFDGSWNLDGLYDFAQQSTQLTLNTEQASLQPIVGLFDLPLECRGMMGVNLNVNLSIDDIDQMVISGNWDVKDMVIPPIEAQNAEGRIIIQNGTAVFDQILLRQSNGTARADAWFRLDQPQFVYVEIDAKKWPIIFTNNNMALVTDANGTAALNLSNRTMKGKGHLSTSVSINDKKLADASTEIVVEEHLLDFNEITIKSLGGRANGKILIPFDDWTKSKAVMDWQEMDIGELAIFWPDCNELAGKSSGTLIAAHAKDKRAFEPLQIDIQGKVSNGSFNRTSLGGYQVSAYLGKKRLLIDKAEIETMNGTIKSSGSISQHSNGYSTYMNADFSQIELNQLVHLLLPDAKPVLGKLTGKGMLVVVSDLHGLTGEANIQIDESDLAKTTIVSTLYNAMNLKLGNNESKGQGQVSLRFEGSSLQIPDFVYFNRGVEIRGGGVINDLSKGRMSTVSGYAVGSARPLKGINLLGIDELDRLMASLQSDVSSVKIQGSLAEPEVTVVPFKEIRSGLRAMLWNQLNK